MVTTTSNKLGTPKEIREELAQLEESVSTAEGVCEEAQANLDTAIEHAEVLRRQAQTDATFISALKQAEEDERKAAAYLEQVNTFMDEKRRAVEAAHEALEVSIAVFGEDGDLPRITSDRAAQERINEIKSKITENARELRRELESVDAEYVRVRNQITAAQRKGYKIPGTYHYPGGGAHPDEYIDAAGQRYTHRGPFKIDSYIKDAVKAAKR